ncbi:MAG: putative dipeptide transporter, permease protein [Thermomicrobiales bacterium]|jgi:peptide/nickel transport system permease protein|nr:putative dipeptide transporter, permease protein [Thermomicrobiales bacterium]
MTSVDAERAAPAALSVRASEIELANLTGTSHRPHLIRWQERNLVIGAILITLIGLVAIFAPAIAPRGPLDTDYATRLHPPSQSHLFGTDNLGRDIFSRVLYGARIDLQVGVISVVLPFLIGGLLGCLAGYYGGRTDSLIMRVTDVIQAFPFLILIIAIVAVLGTGLTSVYVAVALVAWVSYARLIRGEILVAKNQEYIEAARSLGGSDGRVIGRHLLPNVITSAVVFACTDVVLYIVLVTSLSYLGLAAQPPSPEWGAMITEGRTFMATAWWISLFPGLAVVVTGIAFSIFGDGLADALRVRRR